MNGYTVDEVMRSSGEYPFRAFSSAYALCNTCFSHHGAGPLLYGQYRRSSEQRAAQRKLRPLLSLHFAPQAGERLRTPKLATVRRPVLFCPSGTSFGSQIWFDFPAMMAPIRRSHLPPT